MNLAKNVMSLLITSSLGTLAWAGGCGENLKSPSQIEEAFLELRKESDHHWALENYNLNQGHWPQKEENLRDEVLALKDLYEKRVEDLPPLLKISMGHWLHHALARVELKPYRKSYKTLFRLRVEYGGRLQHSALAGEDPSPALGMEFFYRAEDLLEAVNLSLIEKISLRAFQGSLLLHSPKWRMDSLDIEEARLASLYLFQLENLNAYHNKNMGGSVEVNVQELEEDIEESLLTIPEKVEPEAYALALRAYRGKSRK